MHSRILVYTAIVIGALALLLGGWLFYQTLFPSPRGETTQSGGLSQLIFGRSPSAPLENTENVVGETVIEDSPSLLNQIVPEEVAGFLPYTDAVGDAAVAYMEKGTGFIYSLSLKNNQRIRLSNTTVVKTVEALFLSTSTVVVRYEGEGGTETLFSSIRSKGNDEGSLSGTLLAHGIRSISVDPQSQSIFYIQEVGSGARGYLLRGGRAPQEIFSSLLREWNASFLSSNKILVASAAAASASGRVVLLDVGKATEQILLEGLFGLSATANSSGDKILYSESLGSQFKSTLLDTKKSTTTPLIINTLSEKCSWGSLRGATIYCGIPLAPSSLTYPDDWYAGVAHFTDDIWSVDTLSGAYKLLSSPRKEAGQQIDTVSLAVSPDNRYLIFINKRDLSLWSLRLPD